jgi:hypothetical protein
MNGESGIPDMQKYEIKVSNSIENLKNDKSKSEVSKSKSYTTAKENNENYSRGSSEQSEEDDRDNSSGYSQSSD